MISLVPKLLDKSKFKENFLSHCRVPWSYFKRYRREHAQCSPLDKFFQSFHHYFFLIKVNIFVLEYLENIENKIKTLKISISNQENLY